MHISSHTIVLVISRVLGSLILYVALFLYEDEEGRYQNRLEIWWLKLRYGREHALSTSAEFFASAARLTSNAFDRLFGPRAFSLRVLGISICLSAASFCLFPYIVPIYLSAAQAPRVTYSDVAQILGFLSLGLLPAFYEDKLSRDLWGIAVFFVFLSQLGPVTFKVFARMGLVPAFHFIEFLGILLSLSFVFDLCFIWTTRWMLKQISLMTGVLKMFLFIILNVLFAVSLCVIPIFLLVKSMPNSGLPKSSALPVALLLLIPVNTIDILACSVILVVLLVLLLHRLLWPLLERPLYAIARYKIIKQKVLLWTLGLAFLVGPEKGVSLVQWLMQKVTTLRG